MLTAAEELGLREILDDISDDILFSLADTVSKRLLNVTDKKWIRADCSYMQSPPIAGRYKSAIQAILSCVEKPSDLLRRQKITKKVLFSYLLKKRSSVSPESTKSDLAKLCLWQWHSNEDQGNYENTDSPSNGTENNCDWLSEMGIQFASWFFPMYNTLQDFGHQHFWADCRLMGELKTAQDRKEAAVVGASEVVNFLSSLVVNDKFYFDANTSRDSVTSEQDPHGLIRILVSGVVHQMSNCIGLFDCLFGLVRNPSYNDNWKIKWIQIKIHVNSVTPGTLGPASQPLGICC